MDILQLGSFFLMLYASVVALYIAYRIFSIRKNYAYLAIIFSMMLFTHSVYHLGGVVQNTFVVTFFGFSSASIALFFSLAYYFLRKWSNDINIRCNYFIPFGIKCFSFFLLHIKASFKTSQYSKQFQPSYDFFYGGMVYYWIARNLCSNSYPSNSWFWTFYYYGHICCGDNLALEMGWKVISRETVLNLH